MESNEDTGENSATFQAKLSESKANSHLDKGPQPGQLIRGYSQSISESQSRSQSDLSQSHDEFVTCVKAWVVVGKTVHHLPNPEQLLGPHAISM